MATATAIPIPVAKEKRNEINTNERPSKSSNPPPLVSALHIPDFSTFIPCPHIVVVDNVDVDVDGDGDGHGVQILAWSLVVNAFEVCSKCLSSSSGTKSSTNNTNSTNS